MGGVIALVESKRRLKCGSRTFIFQRKITNAESENYINWLLMDNKWICLPIKKTSIKRCWRTDEVSLAIDRCEVNDRIICFTVQSHIKHRNGLMNRWDFTSNPPKFNNRDGSSKYRKHSQMLWLWEQFERTNVKCDKKNWILTGVLEENVSEKRVKRKANMNWAINHSRVVRTVFENRLAATW